MATYDWDYPGEIPEWKQRRHLVIAQAPSRSAAEAADGQRPLVGSTGERLAARAGTTLEDLLERCDSTNLNRHLRQAPKVTPSLGNTAVDLGGVVTSTGRGKAAAATLAMLEPGEFVTPMRLDRPDSPEKWDHFDLGEARERAAALMDEWHLWETVLLVGNAVTRCFDQAAGIVRADTVVRPNGARTTPLVFAITHPSGANMALNDGDRMAAHRVTLEEWWRAVWES